VLDLFVGACDERVFLGFSEGDEVVRDEQVSAFDEFEGDFAFSDAGFADDEDADVVAVDGGAVCFGFGGEFFGEIDDDAADEFIGGEGGGDDGNAAAVAHVEEEIHGAEVSGEQEGGDFEGEEVFEPVFEGGDRQAFHVMDFGVSENLYAVACEVVEVSAEGESWPVEVADIDLSSDALASGDQGEEIVEVVEQACDGHAADAFYGKFVGIHQCGRGCRGKWMCTPRGAFTVAAR